MSDTNFDLMTGHNFNILLKNIKLIADIKLLNIFVFS